MRRKRQVTLNLSSWERGPAGELRDNLRGELLVEREGEACRCWPKFGIEVVESCSGGGEVGEVTAAAAEDFVTRFETAERGYEG